MLTQLLINKEDVGHSWEAELFRVGVFERSLYVCLCVPGVTLKWEEGFSHKTFKNSSKVKETLHLFG